MTTKNGATFTGKWTLLSGLGIHVPLKWCGSDIIFANKLHQLLLCATTIPEHAITLHISSLDTLTAVGAVVQLVEYRTRNQTVAGSTHTRSTASNLEQVANLLRAQANSASYPQRDGKWVVDTATGWRPSVVDWGDGVSASCTVGPIVR